MIYPEINQSYSLSSSQIIVVEKNGQVFISGISKLSPSNTKIKCCKLLFHGADWKTCVEIVHFDYNSWSPSTVNETIFIRLVYKHFVYDSFMFIVAGLSREVERDSFSKE